MCGSHGLWKKAFPHSKGIPLSYSPSSGSELISCLTNLPQASVFKELTIHKERHEWLLIFTWPRVAALAYSSINVGAEAKGILNSRTKKAAKRNQSVPCIFVQACLGSPKPSSAVECVGGQPGSHETQPQTTTTQNKWKNSFCTQNPLYASLNAVVPTLPITQCAPANRLHTDPTYVLYPLLSLEHRSEIDAITLHLREDRIATLRDCC